MRLPCAAVTILSALDSPNCGIQAKGGKDSWIPAFNISSGTGDGFPCRWRLGRKDRKRIRRWAIARGYSSTGRARRSQCRGWGFEPPYLHQPAPVAQRIERRRPKSRVGGSSPSRGTTYNNFRRRSVAQSGQSAGLQNQWSGVRILPLLPIFSNFSCRV